MQACALRDIPEGRPHHEHAHCMRIACTNTIYEVLVPIQDYVSQESAWSSNGSTYQRKYLATLKYSLDICVSLSIFLQNFRSQNGSFKALNFLMIAP